MEKCEECKKNRLDLNKKFDLKLSLENQLDILLFFLEFFT